MAESRGVHIAAFRSAGQGDIVVIRADVTGWTNLTNTPEVTEAQPAGSPDGTKIAFVGETGGVWPEIHVMSADGSSVVRLGLVGEAPNWSPDGMWLVHERQVPYPGIGYTIRVVNANGTNDSLVATLDSNFDPRPVVS